MKNILAMAVLGLLAVSCKEEPKVEDVVAQTAKTYYEMLIQGDYDTFVDGTYRPDSIPATYREQLVANARMYVGQQQEAHRGMKQVRVAGARVDTARHRGDVFLVISYGDSTTEEVVVPMVRQDDVWYMK